MKKKKAVKQELIKMLLEISKKTSSSLDIDSVSKAILKYAGRFLAFDYGAIFLYDREADHLLLAGVSGLKGDQIENLKILGSWEKIVDMLIKKGQAFIVNDISTSPVFKGKKIPFSKEKLLLGAFLAVPIKRKGRIAGAIIVSNNRKRKAYFSEKHKQLLYMLGNHVAAALLNAKLYMDLKKLYLNTIKSLVAAVDARDPYTRGHSERVAIYAMEIAKEMKCSDAFLEKLRLAGLLHDIGKIGIRDVVLSKEGKLDHDEIELIRKHPSIGAKIVSAVLKPKDAVRGILEHHEYYNGKGYPRGIKGNSISLDGRILSVADAYDTLTTDRPYQKAYSPKASMIEIAENSGTQFDPKVVKAFQRSFSKFPEFWHFV